MSDANKTPTDEERERALAAWEKDHPAEPAEEPAAEPLWRRLFGRERWRSEVAPGEDGYVAPRRRAAFPPSFLLLFAAALAVLALEPTSDLGYELLGPAKAVDLGHPGDYHLDRAKDGERAAIAGFSTGHRGGYARWGTDWEVLVLAATPVIVRRAPAPPPPPNTAEFVQAQGRLLKLEEQPASFFERLVRPAARYTNVRLAFSASGEIPPGRTAWLLLDGDVPRSSGWDIAWPLLLWAGVLLALRAAFRSWRVRAQRK